MSPAVVASSASTCTNVHFFQLRLSLLWLAVHCNLATPASVCTLSTNAYMPFLTTAVTALRFISLRDDPQHDAHNLLFVGLGNQVHIYAASDREKALIQKPIFPPDVTIHGFSEAFDDRVAVYGGRIVAVVRIDLQPGCVADATVEQLREFDDWVWSLLFIDGPTPLIAVAGGHSKTWVCSASDLRESVRIDGEEEELTWCALLFTRDAARRTLHAVSGSSFGDLLFSWVIDITSLTPDARAEPSDAAPPRLYLSSFECVPRCTHRMRAHDGPVMRVALSDDGSRLASASVDRSVRVWRATSRSCEACAPTPCFEPFLAHYGHLARVWDVAFVRASPPIVASVGEDRSCRVWSGTQDSVQLALFRPHAGRNVWRLAVARGGDSNCSGDGDDSDSASPAAAESSCRGDGGGLLLATGGEDGAVKTRRLLSHHSGDSSDAWRTAILSLPDGLRNPRKGAGGNDESGRSVLQVGSDRFVLSTDFGRILVADLTTTPTTTKETMPIGKAGVTAAGPVGMAARWTQLFRDARGTAFTPGSLARDGALVFAGQTSGEVVAVSLGDGDEGGGGELCARTHALDGDDGMVMGLFCDSEGEGRRDNAISQVLAAAPSGDLYHWALFVAAPAPAPATAPATAPGSGDDSSGGGVSSTSHEFCLLAKHRAAKRAKSALVTCATLLPSRGVVVVGDKGGRVVLFRAPEVRHSRGGEDGSFSTDSDPLAVLRVHRDRVSTILRAGGGRHVLTAGFDGCVTRIRVDDIAQGTDVDAGCNGTFALKSGTTAKHKATLALELESVEKTAERVDTVVRLFTTAGESGTVRTVVAGFHGSLLTGWDLQRRADLFSLDVGNWRRAHDIWMGADDEVRAVFWRAGRVHVGQLDGGAEVSHGEMAGSISCGGMEFHGGRANDVAWVSETEVMTAGEDTKVRVTAVDGEAGRFKWLQRLSGHISGVNGICVSEGRGIAASCGGSDEVHLWERSTEGGWRSACRVRVGDLLEAGGKSPSGEREALMRVTCIDGGGGNNQDEGVSMTAGFVVGRSDGSVVWLEAWRGASGRWEVRGSVCGVDEDGAVLSVCCDKTGDTVVSGSSGGSVVVRRRDGEELCRWGGAVDGGVDSVDIGRVGDLTVVVSGGDDERVRVAVVGRERRWSSAVGEGHHAAVTGVAFVGGVGMRTGMFVSVGADQRVLFWAVRVGEGSGDVDVGCVRRETCAVADVGGVCARVRRRGADGLGVVAVVCGYGMEVMEGPAVGVEEVEDGEGGKVVSNGRQPL